MRAPYQTLSIPYRIIDGIIYYCVLHRADCDMWQFIAGGGEDGEEPMVTAKREIFEEGGLTVDNITPPQIHGIHSHNNFPTHKGV